MIFGDDGGAVGWLVGEENRGLACMFTMMNNARLAVGLQGVAIAERAYQQALAYANERRQGRAIGAAEGMSPIVEHPDVQRNLLTMKALTAAARAICYLTAEAIDRAHLEADPARRKKAQRARLAADARRQGLLDRYRRRGRVARRAGPWRHGLRRGDRRGAASARRAHRADLRGHQRHPGDRSRHAQAAALRRRDGAGADRLHARDRRRGSSRKARRPSAPPRRACAMPSRASTGRRAIC